MSFLKYNLFSSSTRAGQPEARAERGARRHPLAGAAAARRLALPARAAAGAGAAAAAAQVPAQGAAPRQQLHPDLRVLQPLHRGGQARRQRRFRQVAPD